MAIQNFRTRRGIEVGAGVTISSAGNIVISGILTASSVSGNAASSDYSASSGVSTYATAAGIATYAPTAGVATALQNTRTFQITGDVVSSTISFDGTGNVSLASTIQPDSVGLGTDTTGEYVKSITGTANQITVTGGSGEGSTPVISIPTNPTIGGNVTIGNDLQVNNNLNVTGNITVGGTTAYVIVEDFRLTDADIVLGFTTDSYGNDFSTDTTANHGGIAVASTEGNPLVQLVNTAIGESSPSTYKKFMWFKAGSFAGLNTDSWLSNYAIGIGSTQFPNGTRLAAGSVQFTENDLSVVRNINASGVVTATNFVGNLSGNSFTINSSGINISGIVTAEQLSGYKALVGAASSSTLTYTVTVASKTTNHRYYGSGSGSGYYLNGIESPFLTLLPGKTYRFDQSDSSNSGHPFRFYLDANKNISYTTNVTTNGTAGSGGAYTEIYVTEATPSSLYYQCSAHSLMGHALDVSGSSLIIPNETRFSNVAERHTRISGNTASLVYSTNGSNIGLCTNPTGDITLAVTGIPVTSDFDNHTLTFSVFVSQTGTARSCTAVTLNGYNATIRWAGGSFASATSGVTTSSGMDIYSFTGINTVGSASTTANYYVLGSVNGGYR